MLSKQIMPTPAEMACRCGDTAALFTGLNSWISTSFMTEEKIKFPYGNHYGWCIAHYIRTKLICNVFPEEGAFTVMLRLSDARFRTVGPQLSQYARALIDHRYPCGDGGWIHFRVTCHQHLEDIQKLLTIKCKK